MANRDTAYQGSSIGVTDVAHGPAYNALMTDICAEEYYTADTRLVLRKSGGLG